MDGDMNDIFQKLNSMLSDKETSDNLKNILNNFSSSNDSINSNNQSSTNVQTDSTEKDSYNNSNSDNSRSGSENFNFDINTVLKLKSAMDAMNNSKNDSRSQLLLSLKPYLRDSKKEKIDQYIKLLNVANVIQVMNPTGGENKKNE